MSSLHSLMDYTFTSKYSRWIAEQKRRETWKEAVNRVRGMMLEHYSDKGIDDKINWAYDMMLKKKVLGSQRALQYGGKPALKKHARIYNCTASYCDRPEFFQEAMWLLLCGCGTGFSVQKHHIAKLPTLKHHSKGATERTFLVPDTIEGWADCIGVLMTHYLGVPTKSEFNRFLPGVCSAITFDYSNIRPQGSFLSSGVGKAPGSDGLRNAVENIERLLADRATRFKKLRPIDCYDIVMHASDAVLSGGVRRSSAICIFSIDDEEMLNAKTGDWRGENPQRGRSNNSVMLLRGKTSYEDFRAIMEKVKECGEPGFIWADDLEFLINPCAEIGFWCYHIVDQKLFDKYMETYDGLGYDKPNAKIGVESGWQGCNLSTINGATVEDVDDFMDRGKAAAIIGTLQAGFTEFSYLSPVSKLIFQREALLGVSMTGTMERFEIVLDPAAQRKVAKVILDTNEVVANEIGINLAARTTCLKPEGTTSCALGTSSGIHPHHSKRYLRTVQVNRTENPYIHFRKTNPQACERSVWSQNDTDDIIQFPIEVPDGAKTKNQLPAVELLTIVKNTHDNWIAKGKRKKLCTQPWLSHNVSNTITVMDDEWDEVAKYIYKNKKSFCGISLLPHSGDKDYPQAPFTAVYTPREIVREYGDAALWTSGLIEEAVAAYDNLWDACDSALVGVKEGYRAVSMRLPPMIDGWGLEAGDYETIAKRLKVHAKIHRFAKKYFDDDVKRLTYCMKDVYNWKKYFDLSSSMETVDYTTMTEEQDETQPEAEIACAGGACIL